MGVGGAEELAVADLGYLLERVRIERLHLRVDFSTKRIALACRHLRHGIAASSNRIDLAADGAGRFRCGGGRNLARVVIAIG